jgi:NitT/TauT family transport system substrate-binding protein
MRESRSGQSVAALLAAMTLAIGLVACGRPAGGDTPRATGEARSAGPVAAPASASDAAPAAREAPLALKLGIVSAGWSTNLPLVVAREMGWFREAGVDVETVTVHSGGPVMVAMLVSGEVDAMISGVDAQLAAIAAGAPAVIVGSILDKVDTTLIGAKGMTSVEDLRGGKVIGVTGVATHSEFAVVESLRRLGLVRNQDYTIRPAGGGPARLTALYAGQLDTVPVAPAERVKAEADGFPALVELGRIIPEYPFTVLAVNRALATAEPARIAGLLWALGRAMDLIRQDTDRAVALGLAAGLEGDTVVQRQAIGYVVNDFQVGIKKEDLAAFMAARETPGTPDDFFDETYLRQAQQRGR